MTPPTKTFFKLGDSDSGTGSSTSAVLVPRNPKNTPTSTPAASEKGKARAPPFAKTGRLRKIDQENDENDGNDNDDIETIVSTTPPLDTFGTGTSVVDPDVPDIVIEGDVILWIDPEARIITVDTSEPEDQRANEALANALEDNQTVIGGLSRKYDARIIFKGTVDQWTRSLCKNHPWVAGRTPEQFGMNTWTEHRVVVSRGSVRHYYRNSLQGSWEGNFWGLEFRQGHMVRQTKRSGCRCGTRITRESQLRRHAQIAEEMKQNPARIFVPVGVKRERSPSDDGRNPIRRIDRQLLVDSDDEPSQDSVVGWLDALRNPAAMRSGYGAGGRRGGVQKGLTDKLEKLGIESRGTTTADTTTTASTSTITESEATIRPRRKIAKGKGTK